jgi:hypothetical protein
VIHFTSREKKRLGSLIQDAGGALPSQLFYRLSRTPIQWGMWMSKPNRPRWKIAAGLSGVDAMHGRSEGRDKDRRHDSGEDRQSRIGTPAAAPIGIVIHREPPETAPASPLDPAG